MSRLYSLQTKLFIIFSVLIVCIMATVGYLMVSREEKLLRRDIVFKGKILVENMAISARNTLLLEEVGLVEEAGLIDDYISDIMKTEGVEIIYAMVLNPDGRVISHNNLLEYGKKYEDDISRSALFSETTLVQPLKQGKRGKKAIDISTPLAVGSKKWGVLRVGFSLEKLESDIAVLYRNIVFITIGLLFTSFAIVFFLSKALARPIRKLSRTMDAVQFGQYDVDVVTDRRDELGSLQKSFASMLSRLSKAEAEMAKNQQLLVQAEKMASLGTMAAGVAHEINNPLGGIMNFVQYFQSLPKFDEKEKYYFSLIRDGLKRIQNTVNRLLHYSQQAHLNRSPEDIEEVIERVLVLVQHFLNKKKIEVDKSYQPCGEKLFVDPMQIEQVILNLVLNAIDAMGESGRLRIKTEVWNGFCQIIISDNGVGIPENLIGKMFDPFFTTKPLGKGTGLGLSVSLGIIKGHGGTIEVESKEGKGTSFTIKLPLGRVEKAGVSGCSEDEGENPCSR